MNLTTLQKFVGFIEWAIQNPEEKAALKIAGDIIAIAQGVMKDPRIAQAEADIGAYVKMLAPARAAPLAPAADVPEVQAPYAGQHGGSIYTGSNAIK